MSVQPHPAQHASASAPAAPVVADQVAKEYRHSPRAQPTPALRGVSLAFASGSINALMGPSGSGKSTLLYCLAGLEAPSAGRCSLLGQPVAALGRAQLAKFRRRHVGFVFQSYNLVPSISAYENIVLPSRLAGRKPDPAVVRAALERVGLADKADELPGRLSGGQQQRVAIARVIVSQPDIVFADEPTGALDTATGDAVLQLMCGQARERGQCVVMATHDPSVAARCDRVVLLKDGLVHAELRAPDADAVAVALNRLRGSQ
ncbi:putative ABC transport system ATP-binding protein [Lysobacter enzymogenes]|uniref:ABC transporter ATP-binding protein n=1 Tax=Lysobacter enzymogenes TaxID=69 RepID=UPI0033934F0B